MGVARRAAIALNAEQPPWQGSAHRPGPAPKAVEVEPATVLGWARGAHLPNGSAGHTDVKGLASEDEPGGDMGHQPHRPQSSTTEHPQKRLLGNQPPGSLQAE